MADPTAATLKQLEETLASDPDNPSHHFNLGLYFWNKGEELENGEESKRLKQRSADCFLASAKLNPSDGNSFRFLGHYYSRASGDSQRAVKCYQRAVSLNPDDSDAGEGLCDLLDGSGKESLEIVVCGEASQKSPRAFWAFRRLGYLQVHKKKWSEAVQNLQYAVRGYPACADVWEALGLSYQRLGMFTAAIKAYGRANELEDSRVFALIQSGNILLMLGSFRKGIEQFRLALELATNNASALFGLASGLLSLSKECTTSGAFGWGAALLECAYAKCFPWDDKKSGLEVDEEIFEDSITDWRKKCLLAANGAKCSYQRALHLAPWQANIYTDVAVALDLIDSLQEEKTPEPDIWHLPERMSMGCLMLEGVNSEFWAMLGCLSKEFVLKQHALIRGLQLDASLSIAWAYLGKLYRKLCEKQFARQAFEHARSIDPSIPLPWAGMSADSQDGKFSTSEAYESCLRAIRTLPLAEFQIGLGKLAALSGQLQSPQVFGAMRQAVQHAPFYPESHNLNGLVCEARSDYQSAIAAFRRARCALKFSRNSKEVSKTQHADVSINLARALCQAGYAFDAVRECENLEKDGLLDSNALQIYAVSLWKHGNHELALTVAKSMVKIVPNMNERCAAAALGLICSLIYCISGQNPAATFILKLPAKFVQCEKLSTIVSSVSALDPSSRLEKILQSNLRTLASLDVVTELHSIVCMGKMITQGSTHNLGVHSGVTYLKKVLHLYPDSNLLRNRLSSLLLSGGDWISHRATRCIPTMCPDRMGLNSPYEIHGIAGVACYASSVMYPKFSFPTCEDQPVRGSLGLNQLQKTLHQEPWSTEALYLLVLNLLQKAREEKFPPNLCVSLQSLVIVALSREKYSDNERCQHLKFLTLLTASEMNLQSGDHLGSISYANTALQVLPPHGDPFFAHLQLCRIYVAQEDWENARNEHMHCLHVKTENQIGWIILKYLESKFELQKDSSIVNIDFHSGSCGKQSSCNMWAAISNLVLGQCSIWDGDYLSAEQALSNACSKVETESCLLLFHGVICMELARQRAGPEFLSRAVSSLTKAQDNSPIPLPIVSLLLAQAEASLGSKTKWDRNVRFEWFSWPPEMRPAELYFQMHLLAKKSNGGSNQQQNPESSQSPLAWILRAIHLNPSCLRYWKVLQKLMES